jgi:hypothetical protein
VTARDEFPAITDHELARRLARVYRELLRRAKSNSTADGDEFDDLAPSAADDAPAHRPEAQCPA